MADVAKAAGVSSSSVSRVFSGQKKVTEETIRHVLEVANEIGYRPRTSARKLAVQETGTIGLLLRDPENPSYGSLLSELHRVAKLREWELVSMTVAGGKSDEVQLESLRHLMGMQVAGLIVATGDLPSKTLEPFATRVPVLRAGRPEPSQLIHAVSYDEQEAGRALAELVVKAGHTQIAVIRTREDVSLPEWTRASAMIAAIRAAGLEPFIVDVGNNTGEDYVLPLVRSGAVRAVMCPTDLRQLHFLRIFVQNGISVPDQVSVTGCDGQIPGVEVVGLTSYRLPVRQLAEAAMHSMIDLIACYRTPEYHRPMINLKIQGKIIRGRTLMPVDRYQLRGQSGQLG